MALFTDHSGFTSDDRPVHCTYISGSGLIFSVILLALPWLVVTCFRANHCLSSFSIPLLILFSSPANHDQPFFTRERRLPLLPASALRLDSVFFPPDVSTTTNSPETLNTVPFLRRLRQTTFALVAIILALAIPFLRLSLLSFVPGRPSITP